MLRKRYPAGNVSRIRRGAVEKGVWREHAYGVKIASPHSQVKVDSDGGIGQDIGSRKRALRVFE